MTDGILVGTNAGMTVGEAACPDDAVVLGPEDESEDEDDADERANQSLATFAREANR